MYSTRYLKVSETMTALVNSDIDIWCLPIIGLSGCAVDGKPSGRQFAMKLEVTSYCQTPIKVLRSKVNLNNNHCMLTNTICCMLTYTTYMLCCMLDCVKFSMPVHLHDEKILRMLTCQPACWRFNCGMFWFFPNNHPKYILHVLLTWWKTCNFMKP